MDLNYQYHAARKQLETSVILLNELKTVSRLFGKMKCFMEKQIPPVRKSSKLLIVFLYTSFG